MGIFNYWLSVGPVELWNKGEIYNFEDVRLKIMARPEVETTNLNYQGLLFRFNTNGSLKGPYFGIKTPCCHQLNGQWVIDFEMVDRWIRFMLDL